MIESLKQEVSKHGDKAAVVPVHRLQEIRQDLEELKSSQDLNNFQKYIVSSIYQLNPPDVDFEIRSIILVAAPSASSIEMFFHWNGKKIPVFLPASYVDKDKAPARIEQYLKTFLQLEGHHLLYAPQLPLKRLAVRSGLGMYGRNNICYVEGIGSFLNLSAYYSDLPCLEDHWQEVRQMELCHTCRACLQNCPTAAIRPDRFLIDNERCLTYFNESGGEWDFPDWIDPSSHHVLYGCLRCQAICPADRPHLNALTAFMEFSEEETAFLLEGRPFDQFSETLKQKVESLEMQEYLSVLPRNLRVLFEAAG